MAITENAICYIISYDLLKVGTQNYEPLYEAIKSYGTWAKITESTWAVVTSKSTTQIRDHLMNVIDAGDRLIIIKSGSTAAWANVICSNVWLKENL